MMHAPILKKSERDQNKVLHYQPFGPSPPLPSPTSTTILLWMDNVDVPERAQEFIHHHPSASGRY